MVSVGQEMVLRLAERTPGRFCAKELAQAHGLPSKRVSTTLSQLYAQGKLVRTQGHDNGLSVYVYAWRAQQADVVARVRDLVEALWPQRLSEKELREWAHAEWPDVDEGMVATALEELLRDGLIRQVAGGVCADGTSFAEYTLVRDDPEPAPAPVVEAAVPPPVEELPPTPALKPPALTQAAVSLLRLVEWLVETRLVDVQRKLGLRLEMLHRFLRNDFLLLQNEGLIEGGSRGGWLRISAKGRDVLEGRLTHQPYRSGFPTRTEYDDAVEARVRAILAKRREEAPSEAEPAQPEPIAAAVDPEGVVTPPTRLVEQAAPADTTLRTPELLHEMLLKIASSPEGLGADQLYAGRESRQANAPIRGALRGLVLAGLLTRSEENSTYRLAEGFEVVEGKIAPIPREVLVEVEVVKKVRIPVVKEVVKEVPVEVVKEVPVEVVREVVKEVPVEVIKQVEVVRDGGEIPVDVLFEAKRLQLDLWGCRQGLVRSEDALDAAERLVQRLLAQLEERIPARAQIRAVK